jgi:hypothetical protein
MYVVEPAGALLARAWAMKLRSNATPRTAAIGRALDRCVSRAGAAGRRFPPLQCSAYLARGLRHRVRQQPDKALSCFRRSAQLAETLGARLWQADALFEGGLTVLAEGARAAESAGVLLERALGLFHICGARSREQETLEALNRI